MSSFNLLPGDKYDGRCAEIYITEKQFLIYHCSACEEIFTTFTELLSHITKDHYENTKELNKGDMKSAETTDKKENQLTTNNNIYMKERNPNGTFCEALKVKNRLEKITPLLHTSKSLSQRKKLRYATGTHKSNSIGRNVNTLTRYQASTNDERKYVCAICGFAFKEKYNLRGHLMRHSNQKQISCSTCSKKFFTKVEFSVHECRYKSERQYVCDRCGKDFINSVSLVQHLRNHHSLHQLFKCDQCLKLSSNFHQIRDCKTLNSEICAKYSVLSNYELFLKNHKELQESSKRITEKELFVEKNKMSIKENILRTQNDNIKERTAEGDFSLEQNFDEYELVQTLSDLECSKPV